MHGHTVHTRGLAASTRGPARSVVRLMVVLALTVITVGFTAEITRASSGSSSSSCTSSSGSSVRSSSSGRSIDHGDNSDDCNPATPFLQLNKVVINNDGGTATFSDFSLSATAAGSRVAIIDGVDPALSYEIGIGADVVAYTTYILDESGPLGYTSLGWTCDGGTRVGSTIRLRSGQDASCTVVNDDIRAPHLTLNNVLINDDGGTATLADFDLQATSVDDWSTPILGPDPSALSWLGVGADVAPEVVYLLTESGPGGYTPSGWTCVGGYQDANSIVLSAGEDAVCTIINNDDAPPPPPPSPPTTTPVTTPVVTPATTAPATTTPDTTAPPTTGVVDALPPITPTPTPSTAPPAPGWGVATPVTLVGETSSTVASAGVSPQALSIQLPTTGRASRGSVFLAAIGVLVGLILTMAARRRSA
jgi:hypothetical protein